MPKVASLDAEGAAPAASHLGKHELSFDPGERERYRKDVPNAEVHILNAGHFAFDTKADEIAAMVDKFVSARVRETESPATR